MADLKLAFVGIVALGVKDGIAPIPTLPDRTFRRTVGLWDIEVCSDDYQAKIKYNGWPAGIIDPRGGVIAAGEAANEDAFIAAIEHELGCGIEEFLSSREPTDASN